MDRPRYIGSKIKVYRKEKGLSQSELAQMIGKSLRTVQKYENGECDPPESGIKKIAEALSIDTYDLYDYHRSDHIQSISDIKAIIVELSETLGIHFEIDVKNPSTDGKWSCSLRFDSDNENAPHNNTLCRFLANLSEMREAVENYTLDRYEYENWIRFSLVSTDCIALKKRTFERLSENELIQRQKQIALKQKNTSYES